MACFAGELWNPELSFIVKTLRSCVKVITGNALIHLFKIWWIWRETISSLIACLWNILNGWYLWMWVQVDVCLCFTPGELSRRYPPFAKGHPRAAQLMQMLGSSLGCCRPRSKGASRCRMAQAWSLPSIYTLHIYWKLTMKMVLSIRWHCMVDKNMMILF